MTFLNLKKNNVPISHWEFLSELRSPFVYKKIGYLFSWSRFRSSPFKRRPKKLNFQTSESILGVSLVRTSPHFRHWITSTSPSQIGYETFWKLNCHDKVGSALRGSRAAGRGAHALVSGGRNAISLTLSNTLRFLCTFRLLYSLMNGYAVVMLCSRAQ